MSIADTGHDIAELCVQKNLAYGNSASKTNEILKIYYPNGIPVAHFDRVLLIARMLDKVCRLTSGGPIKGESLVDAAKDIAGYAILLAEELKPPRAKDFETIAMPSGSEAYNGGVRCDMLIGPCACGAWHNKEDVTAEDYERGKQHQGIG